MSIKIRLTPEMTDEMKRYEEGGLWHQARAVLDIVERDLNQAVRESELEGYVVSAGGCIEMED